MRDDSGGFGPQPGGNKVLVFTRREVDETVDAAAYAGNPAGLLVVRQQRVGIAGSGCLARREEPFLGRRHIVERLPGGFCRGGVGHARNLSNI